MKTRFVRYVIVPLLAMLAAGPGASANSAPVVSGVTASQRPDASKLVDIYYDLSDADGNPCSVGVVISDDGGATWRVPARTFSGDIGQGVSPGSGKHVIWNTTADMPGRAGSFRARVYAADATASAPMALMVLVPGSSFQMGDPWNEGGADEWPVHTVWVSTFRIDKYEVTNALYVQFLNAGGNDDHYYSSLGGVNK